MWMGHVPALTLYGLAMVDEWTTRGRDDNTRDNITRVRTPGGPPRLRRQDSHAAVARRTLTFT